MRPRYKPPVNKRYFHTKRKIDRKDLNFLKKKMELINKKKIIKGIDEKDKRNFWNR